MSYVSWAAFYEGASDEAYFEVLLPRVMQDIIVNDGVRITTVPSSPALRFEGFNRTVADVAERVCSESDAFHLIFVHADTGGRGQQARLDARSTAYCSAIHELCGFRPERCIGVRPNHETEAWVLADPAAVAAALGYRGDPREIGIPLNASRAERLIDPKATIVAAAEFVRGRRKAVSANQLYAAIAQRQDLQRLRQSGSFRAFEDSLRIGLQDLGCI